MVDGGQKSALLLGPIGTRSMTMKEKPPTNIGALLTPVGLRRHR
jgi:hypothetical protein